MFSPSSHLFISFIRFSLIALLVFFPSAAESQSVEADLDAFDKAQDVVAANSFFQELDKEEFTDEKIQFGAATPLDSVRQQVWYWAAEWFYDRQDYDKSIEYGLKAIPLCHYPNDDKAGNLNILGLAFVRKGDFTKAAEYMKQCLDIDMRSADDDRISASLNSLAGIYMAAYQLQEAEQYILKAITHARKADNPARMAVIQGMASDIYHAMGRDSIALPHVEMACEIESKMPENQIRTNMRLTQKATVLLGLHQYAEAERIMRNVVDESRTNGDAHTLAVALNKLGMALLCQHRQKEAIPCYREAAALLSKMGDLYNEIHAHKGLYESYWTLNPDSAKIELDRFDLLKDSLYTHTTAENLARFNAEFANDELKQENESMRSSHNRSMVVWAVIVAVVIMAAILIVVLMRKRQKRQIEALVEQIRILREQAENQTGTIDKGTQGELASEDQKLRGPATETETVGQDEQKKLFLEKVIEVVNSGMQAGTFGVEQVADKMNLSVQTFRRRLQEAAGVAPKTFISAIQMENAAKLLKDSQELSIAEIAARCGFSETSSFGHTFKRVYGMSPSQFREKCV